MQPLEKAVILSGKTNRNVLFLAPGSGHGLLAPHSKQWIIKPENMNKKFIFIFLGACLSLSLPAQSQTTDEILDNFFKKYEEGKPVEALDGLYALNPEEWLNRIKDNIENLKTQFSDLERLVGAYHGKEKLIEESLGQNYKIIIYLAKFDRQPVRFTFQFYRPEEDWRLYGFSYDFDLDDDFEENVKLKLMNKN